MRALIQRVSRASVQVEGEEAARIGQGYLVLLGVAGDDGEAEAAWLARKIAGLRLFEDDAGKMNLGLADVGGAVLAVSQFTLYGDARKGRRPSFTRAAPPEQARDLYDTFCTLLAAEGVPVETGVFQAHMEVSLVNDGPVTLWLEREVQGIGLGDRGWGIGAAEPCGGGGAWFWRGALRGVSPRTREGRRPDRPKARIE